MPSIVVTDECIGCESCVELCDAVFVMETEERAAVKNPQSTDPDVDLAIRVCPVAAIEKV